MIRKLFRTRKRKALGGLLGFVVLLVTLAACGSVGNSTGNTIESQQQNTDTTQIVTAIPLPDFGTSQIRQDLIQVEADQALGVKATAFAFQQGDPNPIWTCPAEGLPLPVTDQLSNPTQPSNVNANGNGDWNTIPVGQMDPNGIYQGDGSGTNVLCLNAQGIPYVHYWEGYVDAVTATAYWDKTTAQIVTVGSPVTPTCVIKQSSSFNSDNNTTTKTPYESCTIPKADAVTAQP